MLCKNNCFNYSVHLLRAWEHAGTSNWRQRVLHQKQQHSPCYCLSPAIPPDTSAVSERTSRRPCLGLLPLPLPLSSRPRVIRSVPSASTSQRQVCLRRPLPLPHPKAPGEALSGCASRGACPIQPNHNRSILYEWKCMLIVTTRGRTLFRRTSPIYLLPPPTRSGARRAPTGELRASPSWARLSSSSWWFARSW